MGDIFWVAKISNIYFDAGPKPMYEEKMRVPPPPPHPPWHLPLHRILLQ